MLSAYSLSNVHGNSICSCCISTLRKDNQLAGAIHAPCHLHRRLGGETLGIGQLVRKMPHWPLASDVVQCVPRISSELTISCILVIKKEMTFYIVFPNRVCNESSHLRHEIRFGKSPATTPGTGLWIRQCCASLTLCLLVSQEISSPALNLFTLCRALDEKNCKTWIPRNGKLWDVADICWDLEDFWKNWFILEFVSKYFPTTEKL